MHLSAIRATCTAHHIGVDLITYIIFCEITDFKALCYVIFALPCYLVPLKPKYPPKSPSSRTPSTYVPPSVWKTKFQTHKVLYTLIFILFDSKLDNKRFCTEC